MLAMIVAFLTPKNIGILLLIGVLISGVVWYGGHREAIGVQKGQSAQLELDKNQFTQVLAQYQQTLKETQAQLVAQQTAYTTLQNQFGLLVKQRAIDNARIQQLPDNQVQADLERQLGGALSDIATLRKNDAIVTDYPKVLAQVDNLSEQVKNLSGQVTIVIQQRDAAIAFGNTVVSEYTKAYNAAQKKHSLFIKIITFGLVHDKTFGTIPPTSLHTPSFN